MLAHTITLRVRYPECDPMGYLHHSHYLPMFEMGRTELLRATGVSYRELEARDVLFAVDFHYPARLRAPASAHSAGERCHWRRRTGKRSGN